MNNQNQSVEIMIERFLRCFHNETLFEVDSLVIGNLPRLTSTRSILIVEIYVRLVMLSCGVHSMPQEVSKEESLASI